MTADDLASWLKLIAAVGTVTAPFAAGFWKLGKAVVDKFDTHTANILELHKQDREEHRADREAFLAATNDIRRSQDVIVGMHEDFKSLHQQRKAG